MVGSIFDAEVSGENLSGSADVDQEFCGELSMANVELSGFFEFDKPAGLAAVQSGDL